VEELAGVLLQDFLAQALAHSQSEREGVVGGAQLRGGRPGTQALLQEDTIIGEPFHDVGQGMEVRRGELPKLQRWALGALA
jgi:hypothetical protein